MTFVASLFIKDRTPDNLTMPSGSENESLGPKKAKKIASPGPSPSRKMTAQDKAKIRAEQFEKAKIMHELLKKKEATAIEKKRLESTQPSPARPPRPSLSATKRAASQQPTRVAATTVSIAVSSNEPSTRNPGRRSRAAAPAAGGTSKSGPESDYEMEWNPIREHDQAGEGKRSTKRSRDSESSQPPKTKRSRTAPADVADAGHQTPVMPTLPAPALLPPVSPALSPASQQQQHQFRRISSRETQPPSYFHLEMVLNGHENGTAASMDTIGCPPPPYSGLPPSPAVPVAPPKETTTYSTPLMNNTSLGTDHAAIPNSRHSFIGTFRLVLIAVFGAVLAMALSYGYFSGKVASMEDGALWVQEELLRVVSSLWGLTLMAWATFQLLGHAAIRICVLFCMTVCHCAVIMAIGILRSVFGVEIAVN
jgi:hypothetical protein